jgi:hypothetical protein
MARSNQMRIPFTTHAPEVDDSDRTMTPVQNVDLTWRSGQMRRPTAAAAAPVFQGRSLTRLHRRGGRRWLPSTV